MIVVVVIVVIDDVAIAVVVVVRAAGTATRVAGSNPLELLSTLLSKAETSIQFSSNHSEVLLLEK